MCDYTQITHAYLGTKKEGIETLLKWRERRGSSWIIGGSQLLHSVFVFLTENSTPSSCSQGRDYTSLRSVVALAKIRRTRAGLEQPAASSHLLCVLQFRQ